MRKNGWNTGTILKKCHFWLDATLNKGKLTIFLIIYFFFVKFLYSLENENASTK